MPERRKSELCSHPVTHRCTCCTSEIPPHNLFVKMPERKKSEKRKEQTPTATLRRSPRFSPADPTVQKPISDKSNFVATPHKKREEIKKGKSGGSKSSKGSLKPAKNAVDLDKLYVMEKRVTRSSVRGNKCVALLETERVVSSKVNVKAYEQCESTIGKRVTRGSLSSTNIMNQQGGKSKRVLSGEGKTGGDVEIGKSKNDRKERGLKKETGDKDCERKGLVGDKRKMDTIEKENESLQGWTKEQESALQRAYFTAKPTPHFWKKVAKMVPGKSAEECFEKIYCDHLTPPQTNTRSRARAKPSSLSFSPSKLLSPADTKSKRLKSGKRNCLLAQKTVRKLLQEQLNEDQDYEPDFFTELEPTVDLSALNFEKGTIFSSPAPNLGPSILTRCPENSSSASKKHVSRLNTMSKAALVSPLVLKQIKNKALHEKYIDQLHNRDAKKKAESLRKGKYGHGKNEKKASHFEVNSVKVAKDALIFEAQDAIKQFRIMQSSVVNDISDIDEYSGSDDGDEGEDEL